eukprot:3288355-Lingulodinium_polyedra.AAC.1
MPNEPTAPACGMKDVPTEYARTLARSLRAAYEQPPATYGQPNAMHAQRAQPPNTFWTIATTAPLRDV